MALTLESLGVDKLTNEERYELMELIRESLLGDNYQPRILATGQITILRERLAELDRNPDAGMPIDEFLAELKSEAQP